MLSHGRSYLQIPNLKANLIVVLTFSFRGSTASISSSIYEYRTIHGRTYQSSKTTEYW